MICQEFSLTVVPWKVKVFYHYSREFLNEVIVSLYNIGCRDEDLDALVSFLDGGNLNVGCTYSNSKSRSSIIVIGKTTDASEFNNTYDHEKGHLAMHISQTEEIDPFSEKFQYLTGEIGQQMFSAAKLFLCDHCRR